MTDEELLQTQRALRHRLFEGATAIRWRPGRDLAAQLLLYLDDPVACWRITTRWMRDTLDADRVDGGFGGFVRSGGARYDYVVLAEAQRDSLHLPSVLGWHFDAADPGIRSVWSDTGPALIADVSQERTMTEQLRESVRGAGTAAKLALPVRDASRPIGMMCADWHRTAPRWGWETCNALGEFAETALGPVLAIAGRAARESVLTVPALSGAEPAAQSEVQHPALAELTRAELRVAQLVVLGLSYKEVAKRLDRSLSTVDHQLRSIRDKLGARSTARLVHMLGEALRPPP